MLAMEQVKVDHVLLRQQLIESTNRMLANEGLTVEPSE
jgi:hypothetical protein